MMQFHLDHSIRAPAPVPAPALALAPASLSLSRIVIVVVLIVEMRIFTQRKIRKRQSHFDG